MFTAKKKITAFFVWGVVLVAVFSYQLSLTRNTLDGHRSASFFQSTLMRDARENLDHRMSDIRESYRAVVDVEDENIKKEKALIEREELVNNIIKNTDLKREDTENKTKEELVILLEENLNTIKDE